MLLKPYLIKHNLTYNTFSKLILVAHRSAVSKYSNGQRTPQPEIQYRIFLATNGNVAPSDFIAQNISKNNTESLNLQLLRNQLIEANIQTKVIAIELGITSSAVSQKLDGKISFKPYELKKIFELLKSTN